MLKRGLFGISFLFLLIISTGVYAVPTDSVDNEFKKLAYYAGEYETGNINYVQFIIYTSSIRGKMNEILGAKGREMGGILKEEQLKAVLGEPTEETKWVWSEGEEKEKRIESPVPVWRKIVFDGRKIQIRLNAWPSIFSKKQFKDDNENKEEENRIQELEDLEGKLVYRLNFEIEFKKPEEQLNIQSRIDTITTLAQTFNSDPSLENAETLAKESVNAERTFESYFRQSGGKCEDIMGSIFGTENKRKTQQLYVQEITFCEGENFEVIARLEMCDECEWNWINVDFRVEGRGPGFKPEEGQMNAVSQKNFENLDSAGFEGEIKKIVSEMKQSCDNKDFNFILNAKSKLWPLNEAWNQKSNDVWKEIDQTFKSKTESMTREQRMEFDQNYGWIKQEQEKKQKAKELSKSNYEKRKQFYLTLFSNYDKKESYYTQVEFEKRIIEEFKERGEEICDNNQDDNQNEAVDCADDQCGGKICGREINVLQEGNESKEVEVNFYCIEKECKAREEIREVVRNASLVCQEIPAIECELGSRVFFSRYDNATGCPLDTICLKETASCTITEDCAQPACGTSECIEGKCEVTGLAECKEPECSEGDEKICELDGIIVDICNNGFWKKLGKCGQEPDLREKIILENQCLTANECGEGNVCNNGVCQMLPQVIMIEPVEQIPFEEPQEQISKEEHQGASQQTEQNELLESNEQTEGGRNEINEPVEQEIFSQPSQEPEQQPQQEQTSSESNSETPASEPVLTGNILFKSIMVFFSKISITGFEVDEQTSTDISQPTETSISNEPSQPTEPVQQIEQGENLEQPPQDNQQFENQDPNQFQDDIPYQQSFDEQEDGRDEQRRAEDDRRQEEDQRRQEENKQRCEKDCKRPCIEKCIKDECGQELDCVVEEVQKKCEGNCDAPKDCIEKCVQGGDWWKEFENKEEHKEEKGVFQVGGNCRTSQGKTEGHIWFGGWGEPFEKIQFLKNKYYSGGQADWCKDDFENLKKQRQEFEAGFNQEFIVWFFEKHLANSAENWEQSVSGIFELYWKDVDNSREMAYRMQCLGVNELPPVNLVNVKYETDYGKLEFWEEIKTVKLEGMDKEVQVVSPYMKVWIFPNKEFIVYEMKKSMKEHEFPGDPEQKMERKNEEGPTVQEKEMIKQDERFMEQIRQITENYNGNLNAVIRFVDNDTVVFNLYVQINEEDIIKIQPMLPEEVPKEDVRIDIEFQKIYDIIYTQEKEMSGQRIESPPWDRKVQPIQRINEMVNGVKMYFSMRDMLNSAKIFPEASEKDVKVLMKSFFSMMIKSEDNRENNPEMNQKVQGETGNKNPEEKGIMGNIIFSQIWSII